MTYLLIIFVIALALAPLSHFMPSKRQRQVARMREYAAVHGLFVEFRKLPEVLASRPRDEDTPAGDIVYYGKRLPARRARAIERTRWQRDSDGWRCLERPRAVPSPLLDMPGEVLCATVDEGSCGVFWRESRVEEDVASIHLALEAWSEELCS